MFKPRFLMSRRERERLDARNANLVELRKKLSGASRADIDAFMESTTHDCGVIRRSLITETTELHALLIAAIIALGDALLHHNVVGFGIAVLIAPAAISLFDRRTTTVDVYFGARRQLKEAAAIRAGERTRFDDMDEG